MIEYLKNLKVAELIANGTVYRKSAKTDLRKPYAAEIGTALITYVNDGNSIRQESSSIILEDSIIARNLVAISENVFNEWPISTDTVFKNYGDIKLTEEFSSHKKKAIVTGIKLTREIMKLLGVKGETLEIKVDWSETPMIAKLGDTLTAGGYSISKYDMRDYEIVKQNLPELPCKQLNDIADFTEFLKQFDRIFCTSDTHYFHTKIIEYCNRPFQTIEDMNAVMIERWNDEVGPDDLVIHVGDFTFGGTESGNEVLAQLSGTKILIVGNHDYQKKGKIRDLNFDYMSLKETFTYQDQEFILSHVPIHASKLGTAFCVHGHLHSERATLLDGTVSPYHANVSVEHTNYTPVLLFDVCQKLINNQPISQAEV